MSINQEQPTSNLESQQDELLPKKQRKSLLRATTGNSFSEWFNTPTKGFTFFYTFTMLLMVFGNGIIFLALSIVALIYGRRVMNRAETEASDVANLALFGSYLRVSGRLGLRFAILVAIATFIQMSIHMSNYVPFEVAEWCQYFVILLGVNLFLTFFANFIRLALSLPPLPYFLSIYWLVIGCSWRYAVNLVRVMVSELQSAGK